jgi:hypothetical protein
LFCFWCGVARHASPPPPPPPPPPPIQEEPSAIRSAALAAAPSLDEGAVDLAVSREGVRGEPVTVSVRYLASIRVPFVVWLFGDAVGMTTSTTARQEFG